MPGVLSYFSRVRRPLTCPRAAFLLHSLPTSHLRGGGVPSLPDALMSPQHFYAQGTLSVEGSGNLDWKNPV